MIALLLLLALGWPDVLPTVEPAVQRLTMANKDNEGGTCSAVIFKAGYALTAAHCVDGDYDFVIGGRAASVERSNRILDLAVVKFLSRTTDGSVVLALKTPSKGTEIAALGFAFGKKDLHSQFGYIANEKDEDGYVVLNMDIIFGDSGGIIFDKKGRLIGITSAIQNQGPAHLGLAIPVETVREFIEGL